jgi:hypothetical protein
MRPNVTESQSQEFQESYTVRSIQVSPARRYCYIGVVTRRRTRDVQHEIRTSTEKMVNNRAAQYGDDLDEKSDEDRGGSYFGAIKIPLLKTLMASMNRPP